ncbi:protoporphyrinogen oxidase-like [Montipora capricornis]|uniref:protoporphyrinogen oxidase-like n=1 Tax=Montipora capricornis TaxID=246305 RepID=UPI0035F20CC0
MASAVGEHFSACKFAILGAGISGLSAAYRLLDKVNNPSDITVLESSDRVGGWLQSKVTDQGAVFELGPRSIRPAGDAGMATLRILQDLSLEREILAVPRSHPAAQNRFIYSQGELHQLPTGIKSIIKKNPLMSKSLLPLILREPFVSKNRDGTEESVHGFFERRLSREVADYFADPFCRGIFAGDARLLSFKSCFPPLYELEKEHGSITRGVLKSSLKAAYPDASVQSTLGSKAKKEHWSTWSLKGGLQTLSDKLLEVLQKKGVDFKLKSPCTSIDFDSCGKLMVTSPKYQIRVDHVISGLPAHELAMVLPKAWEPLANDLANIQAVTVAVVNLEYEGNVVPVDGFGFLVPSSDSIQVLGIIFDSCAFPENNRLGGATTRLTVMMGGHWFHSLFGQPDSVDPKHLQDVAIETAEKTLGIRTKPTACLTNILRDCITQYTIGHGDRLESIFRFIEQHKLPLTLIGASYNGVSVNDCIYKTQLAVDHIFQTK